jgi:hypothetical protein
MNVFPDVDGVNMKRGKVSFLENALEAKVEDSFADQYASRE